MMTALLQEIQKLPKDQKVSLMEHLWADLSEDAESVQIPAWHLEELATTEQRLIAGKERFEDWETAKQKIRQA